MIIFAIYNLGFCSNKLLRVVILHLSLQQLDFPLISLILLLFGHLFYQIFFSSLEILRLFSKVVIEVTECNCHFHAYLLWQKFHQRPNILTREKPCHKSYTSILYKLKIPIENDNVERNVWLSKNTNCGHSRIEN